MNKYAQFSQRHQQDYQQAPQQTFLACRQKVRHCTFAGAQTAQHKMQRKEPAKRVNVFSCSLCGGWHLGTEARTVRRSIADA